MICRVELVNPLLLASPWQVVKAALAADARLLSAFTTTLGEIVVATLISAVGGIAVGLLVGSQERVYMAVAPILSALFSVPKIMWYPLLIVWCGIGRMVYAASVAQIAARMNQINITSADVAAKAPWDSVSITGGVLADEAVPILAR